MSVLIVVLPIWLIIKSSKRKATEQKRIIGITHWQVGKMRAFTAITAVLGMMMAADQALADLWPRYCKLAFEEGEHGYFVRTQDFLLLDAIGIEEFKCSMLSQCEGEYFGASMIWTFEGEGLPMSGKIKRIDTDQASGKVSTRDFTYDCEEFPNPLTVDEVILPGRVYALLFQAIVVYPGIVELLSDRRR